MADQTPEKASRGITAEDHVKFLMTAIATATTAPVFDWDAVTKKLSLPSKGATAKRYQRLQKARKDDPGNAADSDGAAPAQSIEGADEMVAQGKPAKTPKRKEGVEAKPKQVKKIKVKEETAM